MYGDFNPYGFAGVSPYGNPYNSPYLMQQQQQQQQLAQNQQQMQQVGMRVSGITVVQVPTISNVDQIQMMPGERKIVFVQDDPDFLAIRVADSAGFVKTEYRRSQIFDPKAAQQAAQYAPMDAVAQLRQEVDALKTRLSEVTADVAKPATRPFVRAEQSGRE